MQLSSHCVFNHVEASSRNTLQGRERGEDTCPINLRHRDSRTYDGAPCILGILCSVVEAVHSDEW